MVEKSHRTETVPKKLIKGSLLAVSALTMTACGINQPAETPKTILTVDNKDSDLNTLLPGEAAIEDVCNAAFEQADEMGMNVRQKQAVGEQCVDAAQTAIYDDEVGRHQNLIGDRVGVTVKVDDDGYPSVVVVQQKPNAH